MANFPSIKPTERNLSFGEYPIKTYRALSGKIIRRSFGNRPYSATLELNFNNASEETLSAIYTHYHEQSGGTIGFAIPKTLLADLAIASNLTNQLQAGSPYLVLQSTGKGDGSSSTMEWLYAESPTASSAGRGRNNISVKLIAELKV
jgi:hypothetical protein